MVKAMLDSMTEKQRQAVEKWLRKRGLEHRENATGVERALVFRAFDHCRRHFPQAKIFAS